MANEVYSGRDGVVWVDDAASTLTNISVNVADLSIDGDTEQVPYTTLGREKRVKVAGYGEEDWTIRGPYNAESEAFWRPLAGTAAGKNRRAEVGPHGADDGATWWAALVNVLHFEASGVNPDGILEYEARLSVLEKVIGLFFTLLPLAVRTTGANGSALATAGRTRGVVTLEVTAVSGTDPTLAVTVETSPTGTGSWTTAGSFTSADAPGLETIEVEDLDAYVRVVGGTPGGSDTPTFTYRVTGYLAP